MLEAAAATYVGDEDPATTYPADLSPGAIWVDTALGYVYTRNGANDGWDPVAARSATSVTAWPFGTIVRKSLTSTPAMVLTDDGILVQVVTLGHGEVIQTGRSIWEPER